MIRNRIVKAVGAALLLATASGCATLSPEQCVSANWYQVGLADGAAGFGADRVAAHANACAKQRVVPDASLYAEGREDGLRDYCTTESGLEAGRNGVAYRGVCPDDTEAGFLTGYRLGAIAFRGF